MDRDGTKDGYDLPMTRAVSETVGIPVVASGGAGAPEQLVEALTEGLALNSIFSERSSLSLDFFIREN